MQHYTKVVIAGVGGVGWPLTVSLCRVLNGSVDVDIYDDDDFEGGKGYTRFPHIYQTKTKKVNYVKDQIEGVWRNKAPQAFVKRLEVKDFKGKDWKGVLVVDCTDMAPNPRKELWAAAIKAGATMMRVSYDGKVANVARGLPLLSSEAQAGPGGYLEPPDLPMSFAAGGWGAKFVLHALETGEVEEGELRVPLLVTKEEASDVDTPAGGVVSNNQSSEGSSPDGGVGNSRTRGGRSRKGRMGGSVSG